MGHILKQDLVESVNNRKEIKKQFKSKHISRKQANEYKKIYRKFYGIDKH